MLKSLAVFAAAALMSPAIAFADSSGHTHGHGHDDMKAGSHAHDHHDGMTEGVHAEATVNSISADTVNLSHGPIPEIGWPSMTMDLSVLPGAQVDGVSAGDEVMMMLEKGDDGLYAVRALMPK